MYCVALELGIGHEHVQVHVMYMSPFASDLQCLCSVQQVGEVKVHNVVPSDDIGIHFLDKVTPFLEEVKRRRRRGRGEGEEEEGEEEEGEEEEEDSGDKRGRHAMHSCSFT